MALRKRLKDLFKRSLDKEYIKAHNESVRDAKNEITRDWDWTGGQKRDIIDTGRFKNSMRVTIDLKKYETEISYNVPYAEDIRIGKGEAYPARDYTIAPRKTFRKFWGK